MEAGQLTGTEAPVAQPVGWENSSSSDSATVPHLRMGELRAAEIPSEPLPAKALIVVRLITF